MIDHGAKIRVIDVEGWYDAGKLDTLLETNEVMLRKGRARKPSVDRGTTIVDPVYVEDGVVLRDSRIGPNVSISAGAVIEGSTLSHTIVGEKSHIERCELRNSMIGDHVVLEGLRGEVTVGDHSEIRERGRA